MKCGGIMDDFEKLNQIIHSFRDVNRAIFHTLYAESSKLEVTGIQAFAMGIIKKKPNISLGKLSELSRVSNSTMSGIVDRLVRAKWVVRERSESDRRTLTMKLTDKGEEKYNEAYELLMRRLSDTIKLSDKDANMLLNLHQEILIMLQNTGDEK